MDERAPGIAAIIQSIATRTDFESRRVSRALLRASWPGDASDRREPGAVEWLRRWGPRGPVPVGRACSCEAGRCGLCN